MRLAFECFEIDLQSCQLFRDEVEVPLERRTFDLLAFLIENPERLIRREELLSKVWHARSLSPGVLPTTVTKLRKALGQPANRETPIQTVRGRGYRWLAALRPVEREPAPAQREDFVGRREALDMLGGLLQQAAAGQAQLALIAGEAGIGKTRVLSQLAQQARAHGFSVWEGSAYDAGATPPYWPWIEIVRQAQRELAPSAWQSIAPAHASALPRLLPELDWSPATVSDPEARSLRFRLFDELCRLLEGAAQLAPRLIAIEDLHWADVASIELLAHASAALRRCPIFLVATLRDRDVALDQARVAALRSLDRPAARIQLAGLSEPEIAELVSALQIPRDQAELARILARRTAGNPFFIRQMLALLLHLGPAADAASLPLPGAVRDILRDRVAALGGETQQLLRTAAVSGQSFDPALLAELLESPLERVLALLEPAHRCGFIERRSEHGFGFAHELLREALYAELALPELGALHARLAHALARRALGADARQLGLVAHHFLHAVPSALEASVEYCRRAADAAREAAGFDVSAALLERALEKLANEGGDDRLRCELLLELGVDHFCALDFARARRALEQGLAIARGLGDAQLQARLACELSGASAASSSQDFGEIRAILEEALDGLPEADSDLRALLAAPRAKMETALAAREREALLAQAQALAATRANPSTLIEIAACRAAVRHPTQLERNREALADYRALARRHPRAIRSPQRLLWGFDVEYSDYFCALTSGDLPAADLAALRCSAIAEESRMPVHALVVGTIRAGRALGDGRLDAIEQRVNQLGETVARVERASNEVGVLANAIGGYYRMRASHAAGALLELPAIAVPAAALASLQDRVRSVVIIELAWLLSQQAKLVEARALLSALAAPQLAGMPSHYGDLGLLCMLAETYQAVGDVEAAARVQDQLAPHADLNAVGPFADYAGSVAHYLGELAALRGQLPRAIACFERALELNRRLGMPLQIARTEARLAAARARAATPATSRFP
jgi:DNA-binding winged helix-turn-helix (wHTH) protein/tetratricopeptide (TPR) repeat protein